MDKKFNLAVVGVTSVAGNEILRVLEEREFPVQELRLLAAADAAGEFLEFAGEDLLVQPLGQDAFAGIDIALFADDGGLSRQYCPLAAAAGAVCIDSSNVWRLDAEVPLVVPEVNPEAIGRYGRKGIIASPDGAVIQMLVALKPLHDAAGLRRVVVSTYQAVSTSGQGGIDELRIQCGELLNGRPAESRVYPHQIAFNCLPQTDDFLDNGYSRQEMQLIDETRRVLADEAVQVTATTVRVPVFYGTCESVNIETGKKIFAARARELLAAAPGLQVVDDVQKRDYPMPIDAVGRDDVLVGRIREDASTANGLNLWVVADNLRKGAATNVVQIAEILAAKYL